MPPKTEQAIEPHREDSQDPMHDPGQILALPRLDQEMKMIVQHDEILDREREFPFRLRENREEKFPPVHTVEKLFLVVHSGGYMVESADFQ